MVCTQESGLSQHEGSTCAQELDRPPGREQRLDLAHAPVQEPNGRIRKGVWEETDPRSQEHNSCKGPRTEGGGGTKGQQGGQGPAATACSLQSNGLPRPDRQVGRDARRRTSASRVRTTQQARSLVRDGENCPK